MEGHGAYAACDGRCDVLLVKAICDWADGEKDDEAQPFAALAATSLCHHVLAQADVLGDLGILETDQGAHQDKSQTNGDDFSRLNK